MGDDDSGSVNKSNTCTLPSAYPVTGSEDQWQAGIREEGME
jgi:hypothetical protein